MPTYQTPGVYIEEISAGPRPIQAAGTTSTGFVAVLELPSSLRRGLTVGGKGYADALVPLSTQLFASWTVASTWLPLVWRLSATGASAAAQPAAPQPAPTPSADAGAAATPTPSADAGAAATPTPSANAVAAPTPGATTTATASSSGLETLLQMLLPSSTLAPPTEATLGVLQVTAKSGNSDVPLLLERDADLYNLVQVRDSATKKMVPSAWTWSLGVKDDPTGLVHAVAPLARKAGIAFDTTTLPSVGADAVALDFDALQTAMVESAPMITSMDNYHTWRREFGRKLFEHILLQHLGKDVSTAISPTQAHDRWVQLSPHAQETWDRWLRSQTGMRYLEVSLLGFFANGGTAAYLGVALAKEGADVDEGDKGTLLKKWFDAVSAVAIIVAPGLSKAWQSTVFNFARMPAPSGRGDIFAILDTPRYLLNDPPSNVEVAGDADRWVTKFRGVDNQSAYELPEPELLPAPSVPSLRYNPNDTNLDSCVPRDSAGFGAAYGPWFIVRNPLPTGRHDAFMVAPPSAYIAGAYAFNDNTFGVHKVPANQPVNGILDLVAFVNGVEHGPINVKGVNLVRHRPGGLLIWGGRTTSTDPLWRYINFRRVFLFIERSVRDAVQWAVFLPNNDQTRSDLRSTIGGFLYSQWQRSVLDGGKASDAYFVQCDEQNNPIETRRNGFLNVDVGIQPPYPAEFVVIRFRQMA